MHARKIACLFVLSFIASCRGFNWPKPIKPGAETQLTQVFSVVTTNPADTDALVANNTQLVLNFSETVNTGSLTYNSAAGPCGTNNLQVSADDFITCIALTTPVWGSSQTSLTMTPLATLANGTTYKIRVLTTLMAVSGRVLSSAFTTTTGFTTAPPGTLVPSMASPSEGATAVSVNTALMINFTHPVSTGTLSYNSTAGPCTGSFQMSADGFVNCIAFPSHVFMVADTQLNIAPAVALNYSTLYRVRVTTVLTGAGSETLSGDFTSVGFTTDAPPALTVTLTTPADGSTGVSPSTTFLLAFNHAVNIGTVSYNNVAGACTGTVQISADGFSNCVGVNAPVWGGGNTSLTLTPGSALNPGALYRVKVTTAVTGAVGNLLASDYITPSGVGILISAPGSLQVFASNAQNMLIWPTVSGALSYNIYFSTSAGVTTGTGTLIAGVTAPYVHTGLTNGTSYFYIVAGANGGNVGIASAQSSAIPIAFKTIFVSSGNYTGALGGHAGADASCMTLAAGASVPGNFRAYISTSASDAACRILGLSGKLVSNCGLPVAPNLAALGPYRNRNAQQVAANVQNFISNSLSAAVGFDENGSSVGSATPFTGTANGVQSGQNCSDWTDNAILSNGVVGSASSTTSTWSSNGNGACALLGLLPISPIYCVQY
ncbi:MAG TPA: Ig-like domain-containing protein [Turneriella sp.]|nr:Ig-like domain-containing protein [Turneriella sp.]